ncbi:hypothetical protein ACVW0Y_002754 [Pseudomonas sp. TE3786]
MNGEQKTKLVTYKTSRAECELELPVDAKGELLPGLESFETIGGLSNLLDSVVEQVLAGEVVGLADSKALSLLMCFLLDHLVGPQLLTVLRAHRRSQTHDSGRVLWALELLVQLASADPGDGNISSLERQGRRAKKILSE